MNKKLLKERKRKMKSNNGITLIALIITIVVLLILAVVTIGAVSDSNIIAHAQNASQGYNTAKGEEEATVKEYETEIEKYLPNDNITKTGVKAYDFDGKIMIFTPENELYQYTKATDLFPSYKIDLIEVKIEDDPTYDITIDTNDFTQEEISKMHLVTARGMYGICTYFDGEGGRDTFYFTPVASGVTKVTITKSMPIEHSEQLLAQYYQDSVNYECFFMKKNGIWAGYMFDYENETIYIYLEGSEGMTLFSKQAGLKKELNDTPLTVKANGENHTITTNANKISINNDYNEEEAVYIENELLYHNSHGVVEGSNVDVIPKTKLINIGALPTE